VKNKRHNEIWSFLLYFLKKVMSKSIRSTYKLIPVFLLLVACASKSKESDRQEKNNPTNFTLPATILAENNVKNLLPIVRITLFIRP
jgi:hypothetical protein